MALTCEVIKITNGSVERAKPAIIDGKVRQKIYLDDKLTGFGFTVGKRAKTFFAQARVDGRPKRTKIGLFGRFTEDEARKLAKDLLHDMGLPLEERQKKAAAIVTLRTAWDLYQQHLVAKKRSATTLTNYSCAVDQYLQDWMDRPLASITREEAQRQHKRLAENIAKGVHAPNGRDRRGRDGKTTANFALSVFRLIWNRAMKQHQELPVCPTVNVDWFQTEKPRSSIATKELLPWWEAVSKIANPVRRDLLKFLLTTGLRRDSAQKMKWEPDDRGNWVDFDTRLLHLHDVKGGEKHAFDLPLTQWHIDLLMERKKENELIAPRSPWVWPSLSSGTGYVSEPRMALEGVSHHNLHDLRRTFATIGEARDVSPYALSSILNHSQPKGITGGYIKLDAERLRAPMEAIVARILSLVTDPSPTNVVSIRHKKTG